MGVYFMTFLNPSPGHPLMPLPSGRPPPHNRRHPLESQQVETRAKRVQWFRFMSPPQSLTTSFTLPETPTEVNYSGREIHSPIFARPMTTLIMKRDQVAKISWWSVIALSVACAALGVVMLVNGSIMGSSRFFLRWPPLEIPYGTSGG